MNILITIAARGGSKGVKNKNVRLLKGKPLISYTIEQALRWGKAENVVVTTDSKEIAAIAMQYGAEVPFMRPSDLATDSAPKLPALRHALIESERVFGQKYDVVVDLDPTAPVRTMADLDVMYDMYERLSPKTLFSVVEAHKNPYFNMVEEDEDGRVSLSKPLDEGIYARQSAPRVYSINGSIYYIMRKYLLNEQNKSVITDNSYVYVMDERAGHDVDREIDFKFLEFLLSEGLVNID